MKRLPRKRKKQVKKIVSKKTVLKTVMAAMVTAQAMVQTAVISAIPGSYIGEKALRAAQNIMHTTVAIKNIMTEPPNSWRDFIR